MGWLINNRPLLLTVPEAGRSKIKALAGLVSGEGPLPGLEKTVFSLGPHMVEGGRALSRLSFIRALIPVIRALRS